MAAKASWRQNYVTATLCITIKYQSDECYHCVEWKTTKMQFTSRVCKLMRCRRITQVKYINSFIYVVLSYHTRWWNKVEYRGRTETKYVKYPCSVPRRIGTSVAIDFQNRGSILKLNVARVIWCAFISGWERHLVCAKEIGHKSVPKIIINDTIIRPKSFFKRQSAYW